MLFLRQAACGLPAFVIIITPVDKSRLPQYDMAGGVHRNRPDIRWNECFYREAFI